LSELAWNQDSKTTLAEIQKKVKELLERCGMVLDESKWEYQQDRIQNNNFNL
jgi:hypothetical protein